MSATVERVATRCAQGGLDLVHALSLAWLDDEIRRALAPDRRPDALAVLVGNTRALWPFVRRSRERDHPVDAWCEKVVTEAMAELRFGTVFFAHRRYGAGLGTEYLPFQRIAHQAGMLHLSPSHLALHESHGPWVALRALLVFDEPGPAGPPSPAPDPCTPCDKPCLVAMEAALADDADDWRGWLAVRDACPVGRSSRYGDAQIAYHYTKDPAWLGEEPT